jgi:hypothetical protein
MEAKLKDMKDAIARSSTQTIKDALAFLNSNGESYANRTIFV